MVLKVFFKLYQKIGYINDRIKLSYYKHLWKKQFDVAPDFVLDRSSNIDIQSGEAKMILKKGVIFRRYTNVICSNTGTLTIGENVFFNNYCSVNCLHKITIGADTIFGEGVKLYDHNHLFNDKSKMIKDQGMKYGAIEIGANCWIGSNTVILPNVSIGNNVIIGANNLIFKSVPSDMVIMAQSEKFSKQY